MTIILSIGFADLPDPKKSGQKCVVKASTEVSAHDRYSLLVSDTVKVGRETATVLTEGITRLKDVVMELDVSGDAPPRRCADGRTMRNQNPLPSQRKSPTAMSSPVRKQSHLSRAARARAPLLADGFCRARREVDIESRWSRLRPRRSRRTSNACMPSDKRTD